MKKIITLVGIITLIGSQGLLARDEALKGGLFGGLVGAGIGGAAGGAKGAAIGGPVGLVGGALIGKAIGDKRERNRYYDDNVEVIYVEPTPKRRRITKTRKPARSSKKRRVTAQKAEPVEIMIGEEPEVEPMAPTPIMHEGPDILPYEETGKSEEITAEEYGLDVMPYEETGESKEEDITILPVEN